jgi:RNA-directed DNA polymerase
VKAKRYRAKLVRRVYIPKENGNKATAGHSGAGRQARAAGLCQAAERDLRGDFLDCSYGYRPGRSAKEAVIELARELQYAVPYHHVVEADIRGFFEHMDHDWVLKMLGERIDDRAFLGLIRKWLKAGILDTDGAVLRSRTKEPRRAGSSPRYWRTSTCTTRWTCGSSAWSSPVAGVRRCCAGMPMISCVRFAQSCRCRAVLRGAAANGWRNSAWSGAGEDAGRAFSRSRPRPEYADRLPRLRAVLAPHLQGAGTAQASDGAQELQGAMRGIKDWIKSHRHLPGREFIEELNRRLIGHDNYYGLRGNASDLWRFYQAAVVAAFKWLNRRGGKRASFTWEVFLRALKGSASPPRPRITEQSIVQRELVLV